MFALEGARRVIAEDVYKQLLEEALTVLVDLPPASGGVVGNQRVMFRLIQDLRKAGLKDRIAATYGREPDECPPGSLRARPLEDLRHAALQAIIVAADHDKEDYLRRAASYINGAPQVVIAGFAHFDFSDPGYVLELSRLEEPSLANGYPNSRVHLYQCLTNAARLGLHGVVTEFGMFRGGTTMFLSRVIERLDQRWPVIGFDTFNGFPTRRSVLDMYDHEDLREVELAEVRSYLAGRNVRIVPGDIRETASQLRSSDVVLAFVDTDNYTSALAAIEAVVDRVVLGGAIVFDHLTGVDRFKYTLGERMAAATLYDDPRFVNLHGTGVFLRQYTPHVPQRRCSHSSDS